MFVILCVMFYSFIAPPIITRCYACIVFVLIIQSHYVYGINLLLVSAFGIAKILVAFVKLSCIMFDIFKEVML